MTQEVFYHQAIVFDDNYDELDFENREAGFHVGLVKPDDDAEWINTGANEDFGEPLHIDTFIEKLVEIKSRGANYVSIRENIDHHGYDYQGIFVSIPTDLDIARYRDRETERDAVNKKLEELRKEYSRLAKTLRESE
jgi:hypothetical protein